MTDVELESRLDNFYQSEVSHWSFLLILFVAYFLSDQIFSLVDTIYPEFIEIIETFTGDYTYAVIVSILILLEAKFFSQKLPEINLIKKPNMWVWITAILILTHPLLIFQNSEGITVEFEIFSKFRRTLDGSEDFFVLLIQSLIYIIATSGLIQILFLGVPSDKIENQKLSRMISVDILPIMGIILIVIYFIQSLARSNFDEIDYSNSIKIIFYIVFSYASMPNVNLDIRKNTKETQE